MDSNGSITPIISMTESGASTRVTTRKTVAIVSFTLTNTVSNKIHRTISSCTVNDKEAKKKTE